MWNCVTTIHTYKYIYGHMVCILVYIKLHLIISLVSVRFETVGEMWELFLIIIKAVERLPLLSHRLCSAGVWLLLASNKERLEEILCGSLVFHRFSSVLDKRLIISCHDKTHLSFCLSTLCRAVHYAAESHLHKSRNYLPVKKHVFSNVIQVSQYESDVTWLLFHYFCGSW